MTILDVLFNIFIAPLELVIEAVFAFTAAVPENPGFCIVAVSIVVNLLCLPLYKRADALQEAEREKQKSMEHWVGRIKTVFKGDERYMMLSAFYREQGYKPWHALKGSLPLLLQIPFFIAAFHFLSNLNMLAGRSFLFLPDLGAPDALLVIGGLSINIMPIAMTIINIVSGAIYTRGFPVKDKVQLYAVAAIFLVLLYNSPSGLVLYWTLNNLFGLGKNICMKLLDNPKWVLHVLIALLGVGVLTNMLISWAPRSIAQYIVTIVIFLVCQMPWISALLSRFFAFKRLKSLGGKLVAEKYRMDAKIMNRVFVLGLVAAVLIGGLCIPLLTIAVSPADFLGENNTPALLTLNTFTLYCGIGVWVAVFYALATERGKKAFAIIIWVLVALAFVDFLLFGNDRGIVSAELVYEMTPSFELPSVLLNLVLVVVVAIATVLCLKRLPRASRALSCALLVGLVATSVVSAFSIATNGDLAKAVAEKQQAASAFSEATGEPKGLTDASSTPAGLGSGLMDSAVAQPVSTAMAMASDGTTVDTIGSLSTEGRNVVVIMLDRAMGRFVPYLMNERPELKKAFEGFTYYSNTLSYAMYTNMAAPALFGGYEYTPAEINKREGETLRDKHDEALTVMPRLFAENGFDSVVADPPYAGYQLTLDLSIYDQYERISAYKLAGWNTSQYKQKMLLLNEQRQKKNLVYWGMYRSAPLLLQPMVYLDGNYLSAEEPTVTENFLRVYAVLENLRKLITFNDSAQGTFLMLQNETTHEPSLLSEDYVPSVEQDICTGKVISDGKGDERVLAYVSQVKYYQTNMAALLRLADWLQYLKENGAYDNTRIVIVADHGARTSIFEGLELDSFDSPESFNPLLLVKDFGATGELMESTEFMTNADVPLLASQGLDFAAVNPFTGVAFADSCNKLTERQLVTTSYHWQVNENNGTTFDTSDGTWYSVTKSIYDVENWKAVDGD